MKRFACTPRIGWQKRVEALGLTWHTPSDGPYWDETAYYEITPHDVAAIKAATTACYEMYLAVGDRIVRDRLFRRFGIPDWCADLITDSWNAEPPALNFGRFDFAYDGRTSPKLLEFNCDTPTSLLEAAVIQWEWKESVLPERGQFNEIHECLIEKWKDIKPYLPSDLVHFVCSRDFLGEDITTTTYLRETANDAGLKTRSLLIGDVGWDMAHRRWVDLSNDEMRTIFKLYPWEWMVREKFGPNIRDNKTLWIEPIWKMMWSNKCALPLLWNMFPNHANLLPAWDERPPFSCVAKPCFGREGRGVSFLSAEDPLPDVAETLGRLIFQDEIEIAPFDGQIPIVGSWIVDSYPAGIGIREGGRITTNNSRFAPHVLE